jgi:hypothetical protein
MSHMAPHTGAAVPARRHSRANASASANANEPRDLFPEIPEPKRRKFIVVEDQARGSRLRVRATLEAANTDEIPDSFRKGASVFPRSYFPREMQSPPPSPTGSRFFAADNADDGTQETEGRDASRRGAKRFRTEMVKVPMGESQEGEVAIPRLSKATRGKEVRLNELGYRMAWLQSRVFAGRTVFLQRALDNYRSKYRAALESTMQDVKSVGPHYEARPGKRRWTDRMKRDDGSAED